MKVLLLAALLSLAGCAVMAPAGIPVSQSLSPAAQTAQSAINEANIALNSMAQVIGQNVTEGIYTKAEAQKKLDQVREYGKEVDRAQELLDSGNVLAAKDKAELAQKLIIVLQREVAKSARKP